LWGILKLELNNYTDKKIFKSKKIYSLKKYFRFHFQPLQFLFIYFNKLKLEYNTKINI